MPDHTVFHDDDKGPVFDRGLDDEQAKARVSELLRTGTYSTTLEDPVPFVYSNPFGTFVEGVKLGA